MKKNFLHNIFSQAIFRVFPLWSDFQPIKIHYDYGSRIKDIRLGEKPLDDSPEGIAGVDPVMIERFGRLLDIGKEFGGRDHTTVLNSIKNVEAELKSGNTAIQNHIRDITANINSCL